MQAKNAVLVSINPQKINKGWQMVLLRYTHLFIQLIHLLNQCLLGVCLVPSSVLDFGEGGVSKTKSPTSKSWLLLLAFYSLNWFRKSQDICLFIFDLTKTQVLEDRSYLVTFPSHCRIHLASRINSKHLGVYTALFTWRVSLITSLEAHTCTRQPTKNSLQALWVSPSHSVF